MRAMLAYGTMCFLAAALCLQPSAAHGESMLEKAPAEHQRLFAEIKPVILKEASKPPLILNWPLTSSLACGLVTPIPTLPETVE